MQYENQLFAGESRVLSLLVDALSVEWCLCSLISVLNRAFYIESELNRFTTGIFCIIFL